MFHVEPSRPHPTPRARRAPQTRAAASGSLLGPEHGADRAPLREARRGARASPCAHRDGPVEVRRSRRKRARQRAVSRQSRSVAPAGRGAGEIVGDRGAKRRNSHTGSSGLRARSIMRVISTFYGRFLCTRERCRVYKGRNLQIRSRSLRYSVIAQAVTGPAAACKSEKLRKEACSQHAAYSAALRQFRNASHRPTAPPVVRLRWCAALASAPFSGCEGGTDRKSVV